MSVVEDLLELSEGDEVVIEADDRELRGGVMEHFHEPIEYHGSAAVDGELIINIELYNETIDRYDDIGMPSMSIMASETRRGWTDPDAAVYDPVVDGGEWVDDDWLLLGDVTAVRTE